MAPAVEWCALSHSFVLVRFSRDLTIILQRACQMQGAGSEQARQQQRELAAALSNRASPCLLYFYSSACTLCRSVNPSVQQARQDNQGAVEVVSICTDDQISWAPEMLNYEVDVVPKLVLLQPGGDLLAKSGRPRDRSHMLQTLECLVDLAKQPAQLLRK